MSINKRISIDVLGAWCVAEDALDDLPRLTKCEGAVWIGRIRGDRYHIYDSPAGELDVVVARHAHATYWKLEIGRKRGRYDGRERWRITLRGLPPSAGPEVSDLPVAHLEVDSEEKSHRIRCDYINIEVRRLRSAVRPDDLDQIARWHASRYYLHLDDDTVDGVAGEFVAAMGAAPTPLTLAEANRMASRMLYRASRELGWSKLTRRERARLGLTGEAQWHPSERVEALRLERGRRSGCGEYTHRAAAGFRATAMASAD